VGYYKKEDTMPYLASLHSLGLCYNRIGNYTECSEINKLGIAESVSLGYPQVANRFIHSEGINQYFKKQYNEAITKLKGAMPSIVRAGDFGNEAVANFYIGKSYWALKDQAQGIPYFLKVDSAFSDKGYIRPDLRETYEILIDYYAKRKDLDRQLHFVEKLLRADRFLEANYKYLSGRIHKEYDTKKLLAAKDDLEATLTQSNHILYIIVAILAAIVIFLAAIYHRTKKRNKQRFEELMRQKAKPQVRTLPEGSLGINQDVVATVLERLEKFEKSKRYLEPDMTLTKIADLFHTNTKYVSKIIQHHKGKKSIDYINGLKIEYIIELLKTSSKARNYTNKALAEEAGFSTTQHFTRAFVGYTGLSPSYFIDELKKGVSG